MASKRKSKGKRINPTFYVFCEGQSEEEYVNFLRIKYRIPIEINSKITGGKMSQRYINNYLRTKTKHKKDQIFLMYDLDVDGILERLNELDGKLIVSNPCIELWFLLHFQDQRANISSDDCVRFLRQVCDDYSKGRLSHNLKRRLVQSITEAVERAERLEKYENPSTTVNDFVTELDKVKQTKNES